MQRLSYFLLPTLLSTLIGCSSETTESENVKTQSIWSNIYVTSDGKDSRVIAELNITSEFGNNISLSNSDSLEATVEGETKDLEMHTELFDVDYRAIFEQHSENTQYTVRFLRSDENATLINTLTLPAPFEILAPQKSQLFNTKDQFNIEWSNFNSDDKLDVKLSSACELKDGATQYNNASFKGIEDDGKLIIDLDTLDMFKHDDLNKDKDCVVSLLVERFRSGNIDSNYASGSKSRALQQRRLENLLVRIK